MWWTIRTNGASVEQVLDVRVKEYIRVVMEEAKQDQKLSADGEEAPHPRLSSL